MQTAAPLLPQAVDERNTVSGVAPYSEEKSMREMVDELQTTVTRLREELALQRQ